MYNLSDKVLKAVRNEKAKRPQSGKITKMIFPFFIIYFRTKVFFFGTLSANLNKKGAKVLRA